MNTFSITCTPQQHAFNGGKDLWCFDYEFEDGTFVESEPLMPEATELMNRLIQIKYQDKVEKINVLFSDSEIEHDLSLNYVKEQDGGSIYKAISSETFLEMEVWLCPVFDQFFPSSRPAILFVKISKIN